VRDKSNGYEALAEAFTRARSSSIGPTVVLRWAKRLPRGSCILDLGCGYGVPITEALHREGFQIYGVDASATLIAKFRERFPEAIVECNSVEESPFFHRRFDAVVAWGLMFLLTREAQRELIGKVARALHPQGQFLFTAPKEACSWNDAMTGLESVSLGQEEYVQELAAHGLALTGNDEDEGQNYYYFSAKV
jgi:2-polyprenyl-3-methyl-5-hydroxy-6-metoxy-1,4-benzoquinol methylase